MAIEAEDFGEDRNCRLAGEDAPLWPAAAFAVLGFLLALTAGTQIFAEWNSAPERPAVLETQARPETVAAPPTAGPILEVKPLPASVPEEAHGKDQEKQNESAVPAPVEAANPRPVEPPPSPQGVGASPTAPAAAPAPTTAGESAPNATASAAVAAPPAAPFCLAVVSIPFDLNSARLKIAGLDASTAPLRDWLREHANAVLSVEGHADSSGAEAYNVLLSYNRAQAVVAWLARSGAPEAQLAARAAGARLPTRMPSKATTNRQVILQIEGVEACREDGGPARNP